MIEKQKMRNSYSSWGRGMFASSEIQTSERELEVQVSKLICEMPLLWINVDDLPGPSSDRAYIERNAIALLSNIENPVDPPSENWLGHYSNISSIRQSGLWNIQHTKEKYDRRFLDVLSFYVDITLGRKSNPKKSVAPFWHKLGKNGIGVNQSRIDSFGENNEKS